MGRVVRSDTGFDFDIGKASEPRKRVFYALCLERELCGIAHMHEIAAAAFLVIRAGRIAPVGRPSDKIRHFANCIRRRGFFNDSGETVATTYSINEGESGMDNTKGNINSININLNACKIIIEPAEGDGLVDVEYTGDKRLKPDVTFENGKLTAKNNASGGLNLGFNINKPVLTIKLGKEVKLGNLEIKVNAGDISLNGVYADYFFGDFNAGNISIRDSVFRKADIDVDAGNISVDGAGIKTLKIDADAGNIDIRKTELEDVTIDVDFGSVNISDLGSVDAYSYDCKVDAGIINIGGNGVGSGSAGRKYKANGAGAGYIKINVDAGNIDIK